MIMVLWKLVECHHDQSYRWEEACSDEHEHGSNDEILEGCVFFLVLIHWSVPENTKTQNVKSDKHKYINFVICPKNLFVLVAKTQSHFFSIPPDWVIIITIGR
jgi:hypothetical protein